MLYLDGHKPGFTVPLVGNSLLVPVANTCALFCTYYIHLHSLAARTLV